MTSTSVFAPIFKSREQDDGTLIIYGKATGSDLDLDNQRCDPDWLKRAMPEWFKIGNIREQHNSQRAVGKAIEHEVASDGHYIRAHIVDPVAVTKTKAGVFTGLSIGIAKPRLEKTADEEWIRDGFITEVSLCDRPALPTATFTMCKAAKPGMEVNADDFDAERGLVRCQELVEKTAEPDVEKVAAPSPLDMPAVKPIEKAVVVEPDVEKAVDTPAVEAVEKSVDPVSEPEAADPDFDREAAKTLAARLVKGDMPPEYSDEQGDVQNAQAAIGIISRLIVSEAQEMCDNPAEDCDISILLSAVSALRCFIGREQEQAMGDTDAASPSATPLYMAAGVDALPVSITERGELVKAKYSAEELRQMLADGKAFKNPDGDPSYPIGDKEDLENAIHAVGRGKGDHNAIRAYIKKRAAALGATDMIPDSWSDKATAPDTEKVEKTTGLDVVKATVPEVNEETVQALIVKGVGDFFTELIAALTAEMSDEDDDTVDKADRPDITKASTSHSGALIRALAAAMGKSANPLNESVTAIAVASTETVQKSVSDLTERIATVERMATPGGPARTRTQVERDQARRNDLVAEVIRFKSLAAGAEDHMLRKGYTQKAAQLEAALKAL